MCSSKEQLLSLRVYITLMRNTFPNEDCIQLGADPPHTMLCSVLCNSTKNVTSSEAVVKDKTVKACKHSSIPRKNCFLSRSVCKLRNSCPSRVGSLQIYHLMQRIIKHFSAIYLFFLLSVGWWRHKDDRKIPISPDRFTLCYLMPTFGLLEIKCPYVWRNHTMEAACDDVNFPCSMVDGVPKLRTDDKQGYL